MSIGVGLFLVAAGAILAFAVNDPIVGNLDLRVVGVILMAVGVAGPTIAMLMWNRYAPSRRRARLIERDLPGGRVVERELPPARVVQVEVESAGDGTQRLVERGAIPPPEPDASDGTLPSGRR
jgi:Domain of unknown function (DUF6458)